MLLRFTYWLRRRLAPPPPDPRLVVYDDPLPRRRRGDRSARTPRDVDEPTEELVLDARKVCGSCGVAYRFRVWRSTSRPPHSPMRETIWLWCGACIEQMFEWDDRDDERFSLEREVPSASSSAPPR